MKLLRIPYLKTFGLLVASCVITFSVSAQDIHFSQFFEAPLLRNPSLAGAGVEVLVSLTLFSSQKAGTVKSVLYPPMVTLFVSVSEHPRLLEPIKLTE